MDGLKIRKTTFTLTGQGPRTRAEIERMIIQAGGYTQDMSRSTDILVTNSIFSQSKKMKLALKWQIPIIDYGQLMNRLSPGWDKQSKPLNKIQVSSQPYGIISYPEELEIIPSRINWKSSSTDSKVEKKKVIDKKNLTRSIEI